MSGRARFSLGLAAVLGASSALADPVVVVPANVRDPGPSAEALAAVTEAVGPEALAGDRLAAALRTVVGRYAPRDDGLAAQRTAVQNGVNLFFADRRTLQRQGLNGTAAQESRRALLAAVTAMEATPESLELVESNRSAYLHALAMLARIDSEARSDADVARWVQKARAFAPEWAPSSDDFPPAVVGLFSQEGASHESAELEIRMPREGCSVQLDGQALPGTAAVATMMRPVGDHRLSVACGGEQSRVRVVRLRTGARSTVTIDPRLDAAVRLTPRVGLTYASTAELQSLGPSDAAMLGEALGASRVVFVSRESAVVVPVGGGAPSAALAVESPGFRAELGAALRAPASGLVARPGGPNSAPQGVQPLGVAPAPSPAPRSAAPWVVAGAGGVLLVTAGLFFGLRQSALGDAESACPPGSDGALVCPNDDATQRAASSRDRASTYTIGAAVTGGLGVVLTAVGLGWGLSRGASHATARPTALWVPGGAVLGVGGRF